MSTFPVFQRTTPSYKCLKAFQQTIRNIIVHTYVQHKWTKTKQNQNKHLIRSSPKHSEFIKGLSWLPGTDLEQTVCDDVEGGIPICMLTLIHTHTHTHVHTHTHTHTHRNTIFRKGWVTGTGNFMHSFSFFSFGIIPSFFLAFLLSLQLWNYVCFLQLCTYLCIAVTPYLEWWIWR